MALKYTSQMKKTWNNGETYQNLISMTQPGGHKRTKNNI